jgi:hypothetical protein
MLAGHELATTLLSVAAHIRQDNVQIEAWLIRFKTREDHHTFAVRAEGALASRVAALHRPRNN